MEERQGFHCFRLKLHLIYFIYSLKYDKKDSLLSMLSFFNSVPNSIYYIHTDYKYEHLQVNLFITSVFCDMIDKEKHLKKAQ